MRRKKLFIKLICISLFFLCFVGSTYSQTAEYKVVISAIDGSDGNERVAIDSLTEKQLVSRDKFKNGELIKIKVEITNLFDKIVYVPKDGIGFNRPTLTQSKKTIVVSYLKEIAEAFESGKGGSLSSVFSLKPNETKSEVILLSDFYDKLKAGKYTLSIERRFWKSPNVISNTITFEVIRSKNQKQWFKSGNAY